MGELQEEVVETTNNLTNRISILVDDLTVAVKEIFSIGGETALHLAVGSGRIITAVVNTAGDVAKIGIETTENIVETVVSGVSRVIGSGEEKLVVDDLEDTEIEIL
jgi:hypothetical protein